MINIPYIETNSFAAFIYKAKEWNPPEYQIAVFQEAYPNKVIYRCPFNKAYLEQCYGKLSVTRIGSNTVSCAGITIGNRDAIAAYVRKRESILL